MEGTTPNVVDYGGHPAASRPALPNLINAVRMLKSKTALFLTLTLILTF